MKAILALENGSWYEGEAAGAAGETGGVAEGVRAGGRARDSTGALGGGVWRSIWIESVRVG